MKQLQREQANIFPEVPPSFDRRRQERVALGIPLRIWSYGTFIDKSNDGTCTDLSEGGVAFDCDSALNVGDVVVLEFRQRGESPYRCQARLSYRMGRRYGAYFLHEE